MMKEILRKLPEGDTVYMICYTSGTTGEPKGALITHTNILSGNCSSEFYGYDLNETEVYLSYVPLTHILEQCITVCSLINCFQIGYSSGVITNLMQEV